MKKTKDLCLRKFFSNYYMAIVPMRKKTMISKALTIDETAAVWYGEEMYF